MPARTVKAGMWAIFLVWVVLAAGCASQPKTLYGWQHYQSSIYKMYVKPGEATPAEQVDTLSQDIQRDQTSDQKVPPGMHAQLGYMAYQDGKPGMAAQQFEAEAALYPESDEFMNRLLSRMTGNKP